MMQSTPVKKSAYAAIGAPQNLVATLRDRISSARAALEDFRDRLPDEAVAAFDQWAEDGERLVETWTEDMRERRRVVEDTVRDRAGTAREVGRGLSATVREGAAPVDAIDGIGPVYAERLVGAGVVTTAALIERCRSAEATVTLAEQTGISISQLRMWADSADLARVEGIGEEYRSMLNDLGVATIESLATADAGQLHARATERHHESGAPSVVPSEQTFGEWIGRARKLAA